MNQPYIPPPGLTVGSTRTPTLAMALPFFMASVGALRLRLRRRLTWALGSKHLEQPSIFGEKHDLGAAKNHA